MSTIPNEVEITITATDLTGPAFASAERRLLGLKAIISGLKNDLRGMIIPPMDSSAMDRSLNQIKAKMQSLRIADIADINVNPGLIMVQFNLLKRLMQQAGLTDFLDFNISQASLTRALKSISGVVENVPIKFTASSLPTLPKEALTVPVTYDVKGAPALPAMGTKGVKIGGMGIDQATLASWAAMNAETYKLQAGFGSLKPIIDAIGNALAFAGAKAQMFADAVVRNVGIGITAAGIVFDRLKTNISGTILALTILGKAMVPVTGFGGGGAWGAWGGKLTATLPILGLAISTVGLWHIALDGAVEALIAVGLAAAAAAVGIAAMTPAAQDIKTHLQAIQTVNSALGSQIPPLTGQFQDLAKAMAPQVIEAYGGALNLVTSKTSGLAEIAGRVVNLFDTWIAKINLWSSGQGGLNKILNSGIGYLTQFGQIFGTLGAAIAQFSKDDPGIAHMLLGIIDGFAKVLLWAAQLPGPLVRAGLAIHGIIVWGGLLAVGLSYLSGQVTKLVNAFWGLAANPFVWVAAAAVALGALAYETTQATPAVKSLITSIETGLSNDTASQAIVGVAGAIGQLNTQLSIMSTSQGLSQLTSNLNKSANSWGISMGKFQAEGMAIRGVSNNFSTALNDIGVLLARGGTFSDMANAAKDIGHAFASIFNPGQAAAPIAMANNVKAIDAEIKKLYASSIALGNNLGWLGTKGYTVQQSLELMDLAGVKWNDTQAVMWQKVQNLIAGYTNMSVQGNLLAGAVNAVTFASVLQSSKVQQLTQAYSTWFSFISGGVSTFATFGQDMAKLDAATGLSTSNLDGLTTAGLAARQQFISTAQAAQNQYNALTTLASAANLGQKGTDMLTRAMKDYVALLIPAAQGNVGLQQTLIGMAQEVNPNVTDFKQLTTWVGNVKNPMQDLSNTTVTFTKAAGNLTTDIQNLSTALGTTLNNAMAIVAFTISGGTKPMINFANAVATTGLNSKTTAGDALALAEQLFTLTGKTSSAHDEFVTFAEHALNLTSQQAEQLWKQELPALKTWIDNGGASAYTAKGKFMDLANNGLGLTTSQAKTLWQDMQTHGVSALDQMGSKADIVRQHFYNLEQQLFATQQHIDSLHGKTFGIVVDANGYVNVNGYAISAGAYFSPHAAGGRITDGMPYYGNKGDDVLISAKRGEAIVPANKVQQVAPALGAAGVPGFAGGGVIGDHGNLGFNFFQGAVNNIESDAVWATSNVARNATKAFAKYVASTIAAMGSGSSIVKYAESFLGKIPYVWGGTSLNYLGADCSGFTQSIYSHFGINAPRTSEAQGGWVKKGAPTPGGLAFYHSPAGGHDPGHVAIVAGGGQVVSQGGGMGPTMQRLNFLPLLWTGVPPSGFAVGGTGSSGTMTAGQVAALWDQQGGRASAAGNMARIAYAESGDRPGIVQQGQPPGLTGWGLYQITPTSGISQNGAFGNLLNAANNTRAAISLYNGSGYLPWASDPVASQLISSGLSYDSGGWLKPGWNPPMYNGTGAPEHLSRDSGGGQFTFHIDPGGGSEFEMFMAKLIRKYVKVKHGGNAQRAFGNAGVVSGSSNWRSG